MAERKGFACKKPGAKKRRGPAPFPLPRTLRPGHGAQLPVELAVHPRAEPRLRGRRLALLERKPAHAAVFVRLYAQGLLLVRLQQIGHVQVQVGRYVGPALFVPVHGERLQAEA